MLNWQDFRKTFGTRENTPDFYISQQILENNAGGHQRLQLEVDRPPAHNAATRWQNDSDPREMSSVPSRDQRRAKLAALAAARQERQRRLSSQSPGTTPFARRRVNVQPSGAGEGAKSLPTTTEPPPPPAQVDQPVLASTTENDRAEAAEGDVQEAASARGAGAHVQFQELPVVGEAGLSPNVELVLLTEAPTRSGLRRNEPSIVVQPPPKPDAAEDSTLLAALHEACSEGNEQTIRLLAQRGADINAKDSVMGWSAVGVYTR